MLFQVNNEKNRNAVIRSKTNSALWDCAMRRTITLRCTKVFSDEVLTRLVNSIKTKNSTIQKRLQQQAKWRPQSNYGGGVIDDAELLELRQQAIRNVNMVQQTLQDVFLSDQERGYVRRFPAKSCWPLKSGGGGHRPSSLSGTDSSLSSFSSPSAEQLSASDLRANLLAFYDGKQMGAASASAAASAAAMSHRADSAAAAIASSTSSSGSTGSSNRKKRKQPPTAAAD